MSNPQLSFPSPLDQQVKTFVSLASTSLRMRIPPGLPTSDAFIQIFLHPQLAPSQRIMAGTLLAHMVCLDGDKNIPIIVGLNGGILMRAIIDVANDPQSNSEIQTLSATAIGIIAERAPQMLCPTPNAIKTYVNLLASEDKGI